LQYNLYTVSVTNNSAVVTGAAGTKFLTKVAVGNSFKIKHSPVVYQVASISSDTSLTLSTPYAGATESNVQYQVTTDYTANFGLAEINIGDQDWPVHLTVETIRKIDTILATTPTIVAVPSTSTSIGAVGQLAWDSSYLYLCVATNVWKRIALSSW